MTRMARIPKCPAKPPTLTPEHRPEDEEIMRFCHAAAVRLCQTLDREEAEAGCAGDYGSPTLLRRSRRKASAKSVPSVVKKGVKQ